MACAGLETNSTDRTPAAAAKALIEAALNYIQIAAQFELQTRVGIHTGPITAGVIGQKVCACALLSLPLIQLPH